ncbi:LytR/AlgR family response regulator transcription factor [Ekhidna sp.]
MAGRKLRFILYCIYMIIVSIYLELLVMVLAFVILADYQIDNLGKIAGDIYLLTVILYFIVFFDGLILAIQKMNEKDRIITEMEDELNKNNQSEISIKVKRKNIPLKLEDILYVESLGDYVKVHTSDQVHITKEKISALDERLPNSFVRIHRSFLINRDHIQSYNKEFVTVNNIELTIGRKYKNVVEERL